MNQAADQYNRDVEFRRLQQRVSEQEDQITVLGTALAGMNDTIVELVNRLVDEGVLR